MIGKTISHYKIIDKIGEGGMGVVYKAEDTKLKRSVALKFLTPQALRSEEEKTRFINEAQAAAALDHPNICTVHEIDEANGQTFIAMACIEGQNVKDKIDSGPLKVDEAIDLAIQVAQGLQEAHEKGIIHQDIKSGNIMVTSKGQVKIMDFGLAKLSGAKQISKADTTTGTLAYMSPEQVERSPVDRRTDIWSLGIVLYEMLTRQVPFKGDYKLAVEHSILTEDPESIIHLNKEVPESLDRIVKKALEKDPAQRHQSMGEMLSELQAAKKELKAGRVPELERKKRVKTRRAILISTAAVLALVLILMVWFVPRREVQIRRRIPIGVMFFDNQTGEDKYDYLRKVLADMLITDLGQSRYLQVMTFPRMFDLLKSLGHENAEVIDASMGFKLCNLANAHIMVLGSLIKSGETFGINTQVLEVETKAQLAAYRITGKGEDSILGHMIDDLTDQIKKGLEISAREIQQEKKGITELTTTSLEAYKYYFKGREAAFQMYNQEAIENLEKAVALDSAFVDAYDALARQYYTIGENTKALDLVEKVKTLSGKLTEEKLVEILALEAYIKHDWDLAINYFRRLIDIDPENIAAHIDLGTIYYQKKMMCDEGISEFKRALELDPQGVTHNSSFAYNVLGWAYLRKGEWKKALAAFNEYVDLLPNQAYPLDILAETNLLVGNYDQAMTNLQQSQKIKPDFPLTFVLFGYTYFAKGMYDQALHSFERYLACPLGEAQKGEAHFYLAELHYLKGDYEKAVKECQQALELNPETVGAHWILGLTYVKKGMFDQAESEVLTVKELVEKTKTEQLKTYYYHLLGELSLSKGFNPQALENFTKAAGIWSTERIFYINALGEAYFKTGELNKAEEKFQAVLEINPNYAQTHFLLGMLYEEKGRKEKAREHFQKFIDIWKDADENLPQLIEVKKRLEKL